METLLRRFVLFVMVLVIVAAAVEFVHQDKVFGGLLPVEMVLVFSLMSVLVVSMTALSTVAGHAKNIS